MSNSDDYPGTYGYNGFYLVWNGVAQEWSKLNAGKSLVTKSMIQVPAKTICFIDSRDGWASSPFTQQYNQPAWSMTASADRHNIGWNVSFCDGHVKWYSSNWQSPIVSNDYLWAVNKRNFSK
jgi:prepilin-type processing-associated H-X9-DG protein